MCLTADNKNLLFRSSKINLFKEKYSHTYTCTRPYCILKRCFYSGRLLFNENYYVLLQVRSIISINWQRKKSIRSACPMIMTLLCTMRKIPFRKALIWIRSYLWKPMEKRDPRSDKELDWARATSHKRIFCTSVTVRI